MVRIHVGQPMMAEGVSHKLTSQRALTCALTNQFATPGLGSILGGRIIVGILQLLLALGGFSLVTAWFVLTFRDSYRLAFDGVQPTSHAILAISGALIFIASWCWSLVTSIRMILQAKAAERNALRASSSGTGPAPNHSG